MKIDKSNMLHPMQMYQANQLKPKPKQEAAAKNDQVQISSAAKRLQQADARHEERINALAEKVGNGTYQVDANKLAQFFVEQIKNRRLR